MSTVLVKFMLLLVVGAITSVLIDKTPVVLIPMIMTTAAAIGFCLMIIIQILTKILLKLEEEKEGKKTNTGSE